MNFLYQTARRFIIAILIAAIRLYRMSFSMLIGRSCRFEPSCSSYAIEAIQIWGPWRGMTLAVKRLGACHPFPKLGARSGYDPVPPICHHNIKNEG